MKNNKNIKNFITLINTDFNLRRNYCVFYKKIYFYFIKDIDNKGLNSIYSHLYKHFYAVLVVHEIKGNEKHIKDKSPDWVTARSFLKAWAFSNGYKLNFICTFRKLEETKHLKSFLMSHTNIMKDPIYSKNSRKETEFEKILDTDGEIKNKPESYKKTGTKAKLLSLYSATESDINVFFKIIFFINTISFPNENDKEAFVNYVTDFFACQRNEANELYSCFILGAIESSTIFGSIGSAEPNSGGGVPKYGLYFYENIRDSIVHMIRSEKKKNNKENENKNEFKFTDIEIDNYDQIRILDYVAEMLRIIARAKLVDEGIYDCYLSNKKCYLIHSSAIKEAKETVNAILNPHIQRIKEAQDQEKIFFKRKIYGKS